MSDDTPTTNPSTDGSDSGAFGDDSAAADSAESRDAGDNISLPLDGLALVKAGAKASVGPSRLPALLREVQSEIDAQFEEFRRRHEQVYDDPNRTVFLAGTDYWTTLGQDLGLAERETDAVRRAHAEQLRRMGEETGRSEEFETAMEIRHPVVINRDSE